MLLNKQSLWVKWQGLKIHEAQTLTSFQREMERNTVVLGDPNQPIRSTQGSWIIKLIKFVRQKACYYKCPRGISGKFSPTCPFIHLSIHPLTHPPIHSSLHHSIHPLTHPATHPSNPFQTHHPLPSIQPYNVHWESTPYQALGIQWNTKIRCFLLGILQASSTHKGRKHK